MNLIKSKLGELQDQSLQELVEVTNDFLNLAQTLYQNNKLTQEEYTELTYHKKEFLKSIK